MRWSGPALTWSSPIAWRSAILALARARSLAVSKLLRLNVVDDTLTEPNATKRSSDMTDRVAIKAKPLRAGDCVFIIRSFIVGFLELVALKRVC